jgi:mono-ADP-ribosyltransferase sirtuin 6
LQNYTLHEKLPFSKNSSDNDTVTPQEEMLDYNSRLKPVSSKGKCGDPEYLDTRNELLQKVNALVKLIKKSKYTVIFTGAGISTSCGIPDFRGPNGIWTREKRGEIISKEEKTADLFNKAKPSFTHYSLVSLMSHNFVHHIISQNVDSLHLKSGIPLDKISEIHGNIFMEICEKCGKKYLSDYDIGGMGLQYTGNFCSSQNCRNGKLRDFAIDWDTDLPKEIIKQAKQEIRKADLILCLGTSLRIHPAGDMPLEVFKTIKNKKKPEGKASIVIVNRQKTHLDKKATIKIHYYVDDVMRLVCKKLGIIVIDHSATDESDTSQYFFEEKTVRYYSKATDDDGGDEAGSNDDDNEVVEKIGNAYPLLVEENELEDILEETADKEILETLSTNDNVERMKADYFVDGDEDNGKNHNGNNQNGYDGDLEGISLDMDDKDSLDNSEEIITCYDLVDLTDDPSRCYQSEDKVDIQEKKRPRVS